MFHSFMTEKQVGREVVTRLLKVVQEFIIKHYPIGSTTSVTIEWWTAEFMEACNKVNTKINFDKIFPQLCALCKPLGWELSLSQPAVGRMYCVEVGSDRDVMLTQILEGAEEPDSVVVVVKEKDGDGDDGYRVIKGKRPKGWLEDVLKKKVARTEEEEPK